MEVFSLTDNPFAILRVSARAGRGEIEAAFEAALISAPNEEVRLLKNSRFSSIPDNASRLSWLGSSMSALRRYRASSLGHWRMMRQGMARAVTRLVAGMLGFEFDDFWHRTERAASSKGIRPNYAGRVKSGRRKHTPPASNSSQNFPFRGAGPWHRSARTKNNVGPSFRR
jgi:hypothetical protein